MASLQKIDQVDPCRDLLVRFQEELTHFLEQKAPLLLLSIL